MFNNIGKKNQDTCNGRICFRVHRRCYNNDFNMDEYTERFKI